MLSPLQYKLRQNFVFVLLTLMLNVSPGGPKLSLILQVGPSRSTKKIFCDCKYEMINYYQHQKLQHS